ncbi:hypothetical protein COV13_03610 [Candidatus Woesearchaeota archaeon CG10_big_fil_rev_8_21_14_0_10_32_9]|nr:MAG: hypothetical protein COV13_03610 [Candidatus Woesearchaeota archaeon CG10_big_fil_rev_8_21_14_0_10_32_9]
MNKIQQIQELFKTNATADKFLLKTISEYKGNSVDDFCKYISQEITIQFHFPIQKLELFSSITTELDELVNTYQTQDVKELVLEMKRSLRKYSSEAIYKKPEHIQLSELVYG